MSVGVSGRFDHGSAPRWPEERADEVRAIVLRYPRSRSAIMPLLHLAQAERGFIAHEDLEAIARILELPVARVESTASFYTLYHGHAVGRWVITVCTNIGCHLLGARDVVAALADELGIEPGQTTPDGLFTLEATSECLAACDAGPVAQVNLEYALRLTPDRALRLVRALKLGDQEALAALLEHEAAAQEVVVGHSASGAQVGGQGGAGGGV